MKVKIQVGGLVVYAETNEKPLHYSDLEETIKIMAVAFGIDYDSFLNVTHSDAMDKFAEDLRKEILENLEYAKEFNEAKEAAQREWPASILTPIKGDW